MSTHLDAPLELATQGFAVFPLATRYKVPAIPKTAGGHGCLDATTDAELVEELWERSPPIPTARVSADGSQPYWKGYTRGEAEGRDIVDRINASIHKNDAASPGQ